MCRAAIPTAGQVGRTDFCLIEPAFGRVVFQRAGRFWSARGEPFHTRGLRVMITREKPEEKGIPADISGLRGTMFP